MKTYRDILAEYLPENAVSMVLQWIESHHVQLKITRNRSTKLGDYRPPQQKKFHRITVNHDLNKYHFLITLIHECAHLVTWEAHQRKVKPHGNEWKAAFREMMKPYLIQEIFPSDLIVVITHYLKNPSSSSSDTKLLTALRNYDGKTDYLTLEDLPPNSVFSIHNGIVFMKMDKLRKRFKCRRIDNNRMYLVSPLMKVTPVLDKSA